MKEDQLQEGGGRGLFTLKNIFILLLGFAIGYIIKGQAVQNITMGYDDYKIVVTDKTNEGIANEAVQSSIDSNNAENAVENKEESHPAEDKNNQ